MATVSDSIILLLSLFVIVASASNFSDNFELTWGEDRAKILEGGKLRVLSVSLDNASGSGFLSKREYLFGRIDIQIKLVAGDSADTVTSYYLSSGGEEPDEIDFELLGNVSGDPYTVYSQGKGKGDKEQQFHLCFDPTKTFHTYSILWNSLTIIFLVDNIPIRVFDNLESIGVPFPNNQPMKLYSSLWNADQWATRGGLIKSDWAKAPFTAYYRDFRENACVWYSSSSSSCSSISRNPNRLQMQGIDAIGRRRLRWVRKYYMIYDYCRDLKRFPQGRPRKCRRSG